MAAERRRMRLVYADTIKDLLANCVIQDGERLRWEGQLMSYLLPSVSGRKRKEFSLGYPPNDGLRPV